MPSARAPGTPGSPPHGASPSHILRAPALYCAHQHKHPHPVLDLNLYVQSTPCLAGFRQWLWWQQRWHAVHRRADRCARRVRGGLALCRDLCQPDRGPAGRQWPGCDASTPRQAKGRVNSNSNGLTCPIPSNPRSAPAWLRAQHPRSCGLSDARVRNQCCLCVGRDSAGV